MRESTENLLVSCWLRFNLWSVVYCLILPKTTATHNHTSFWNSSVTKYGCEWSVGVWKPQTHTSLMNANDSRDTRQTDSFDFISKTTPKSLSDSDNQISIDQIKLIRFVTILFHFESFVSCVRGANVFVKVNATIHSELSQLLYDPNEVWPVEESLIDYEREHTRTVRCGYVDDRANRRRTVLFTTGSTLCWVSVGLLHNTPPID